MFSLEGLMDALKIRTIWVKILEESTNTMKRVKMSGLLWQFGRSLPFSSSTEDSFTDISSASSSIISEDECILKNYNLEQISGIFLLKERIWVILSNPLFVECCIWFNTVSFKSLLNKDDRFVHIHQHKCHNCLTTCLQHILEVTENTNTNSNS